MHHRHHILPKVSTLEWDLSSRLDLHTWMCITTRSFPKCNFSFSKIDFRECCPFSFRFSSIDVHISDGSSVILMMRESNESSVVHSEGSVCFFVAAYFTFLGAVKSL